MSKGLYPQPTMASSSVDSSQVGERCWVLVLDDAGDEENEATLDLRENLIEKIKLIEKLKEPLGIEYIFGTPKRQKAIYIKPLSIAVLRPITDILSIESIQLIPLNQKQCRKASMT